LLDRYDFTGILHFGAIAHAEWCEADARVCDEKGVGRIDDLLTVLRGDTRKRWWKGGKAKPWIVLGSGIDVYPGTGAEMSTVGANMLANEQALKQYVESTKLSFESSSAPGAGSIVRLSTVYGYSPDIALPDSFVPTMVSNSIVSAHAQFDSDLPPLDLLHVDDALDGILSIIKRHGGAQMEAQVEEFDLVAGRRTDRRDLVKAVRQLTSTRGSLKDIGTGKVPQSTWKDYTSSVAENVLGWKPKHDLASGLRANIETVLHATAEWTYNYISANCPSSNVLEVSQGPNVLLSNRNNKDLTRLDGCTVNIAFERDGFLDHVKCPSRGTESECTVDNAYVASYNWDASVFIIRRQKSAGNRQKEKERQVRVSFDEEKGRGVLGLLEGDSVFELLPTGTEGQSVFDLEVSWYQLPRK